MRKLALPGTLALTLAGALAVAVGLAAADHGRLHGANGRLWVTERTVNSVTAYDAATGRVLGTTPVGRQPIGIVEPRGTGKAYSTDETDNRVSVIDADTVTVIGTIRMGLRPHHAYTPRNGRWVFVGEFGQNTVGVIDTRTDTRVAGCPASPNPAARTHAAWAIRGGRLVFATNEVTNDVGVMAFDGASCTLLFNVPVGNRPSEVLVPEHGRVAYVSVRNENKVKEIDLRTRMVTREVFVGEMPDTLQLTPNGKTLIVTLRGAPPRITYVDLRSFTAEIVAVGPGTITGHHWLSTNGRYTFVAVENTPNGYTSVVDNRTRTVVATYPYPAGPRPHGVFFAPRGDDDDDEDDEGGGDEDDDDDD
jgi:YVTN family beta-propeller protein